MEDAFKPLETAEETFLEEKVNKKKYPFSFDDSRVLEMDRDLKHFKTTLDQIKTQKPVPDAIFIDFDFDKSTVKQNPGFPNVSVSF